MGLGNPGPEYERTRHNAGFWWVHAFAHSLGANWQHDKNYKALIAHSLSPKGHNTGQNAGQKIWLLQPQTFMNLSGLSVAAVARFYKIAPQEILVIHDELDIAPGLLKLKLGGGHAGHNGLRDITAQLGTADFWRLRVGIGHPGVKSEVASWVLKKAPADQQTRIEDALTFSLKAGAHFFNGEWPEAQRLLHSYKPALPAIT